VCYDDFCALCKIESLFLYPKLQNKSFAGNFQLLSLSIMKAHYLWSPDNLDDYYHDLEKSPISLSLLSYVITGMGNFDIYILSTHP